ncbi:uncharacterized protein BX663DRAFT_427048 [Cokeromyces recurvatus]|uniref:uncharacterized protein n=1 Tax=Cokeromyces recurvatus TaxID=90255 RepID=UPI00221E7E24|nr:uncharacterized protein BX663DRAFT_427048 [Cokeromyces recurvatus]KAI7907175.1 hypothetical protein BX663DRAFT_427048 [Cokeromyces recurvatus]
MTAKSIKKTRLFPSWILKLIGITSLASAVIGFAIYWLKKYPPRRKIKQDDHPMSQTNNFLNNLKSTVRKSKKRMTISLKNARTVLWNPSTDVDTPIYGFRENIIHLLVQLSYLYDIYIIVHVNSEEEKTSIQSLLTNGLLSIADHHIDSRKIIYCSEEEGKIHIVRHLEPFIHIEGGWEVDDGEDIVKKLKPFVHKIIWILTKRRRDSFKPENIRQEDRHMLGQNIEISESLIDTSVAQEVK